MWSPFVEHLPRRYRLVGTACPVRLRGVIPRAGPACAPLRGGAQGPRPRLLVGRALDGGQGRRPASLAF